MRIAKVTIGLALALAVAMGAWAHPDHEHKLMGTVSAVDEERIEIETQDGEKVSIPLTTDTSYKRGEEAGKAADVAVGGRVVVFYKQDENKVKRATKIMLPEAKAGESQQ